MQNSFYLLYELDYRHLGCVAAARTGLCDTAVSAVLVSIGRCYLIIQLFNN